MQWDSSANSGFSDGTPWLPVDENHITVNVKGQASDRDSLLSFYRSLISIRKQHEALQAGDITFLKGVPPDAIVYIRCRKDASVLVVLNFTKKTLTLDPGLSLPEEAGQTACVLLGTHRAAGAVFELGGQTDIKPYEVLITTMN